ncbi:hypothetical protein BDP27DRAFT_1413817 [Rhodocollybia butyracea]|uniref:HNH nuclease domain-containing protein n=1 Tax=Rhodocollybia butyracea TaxID=206335 RepID=A0A9P5UFL4_9AGAR|nr:hypothetical protein BDP27DRAFT_1413817 [Rhodocollybia butyracea]
MSVLAVLQRFDYGVSKINGSNVHSLFNILTLEHTATCVENCYRVVLAPPFDKAYNALRVPKQVTFTSFDPDNLPLPSPELLALHAAHAKLAHLACFLRIVSVLACSSCEQY